MQPSPVVVPFETHFVADENTATKVARVAVINMVTTKACWITIFILAFFPIAHGVLHLLIYRNSDGGAYTVGGLALTYFVVLGWLLLVSPFIWVWIYFRSRKMFREQYYFPGAQSSIRFDAEGYDHRMPTHTRRTTYASIKKIFYRGDAIVIKQRRQVRSVVYPRALFTDTGMELVKRFGSV